MVYRIFVEKKAGLANEAASLLSEIKNLLKIETVTGDAVKDYSLYFIDYTQSPSTVVKALQDNGFGGVSIRKAQ